MKLQSVSENANCRWVFLDGDGALCVQPVQVTVLWRPWWREDLVHARYWKKSATEACLLLPPDSLCYGLYFHRKQKHLAENSTQEFVCVINSRGEPLALSPLREPQKLDQRDLCDLELLEKSKYTDIDTKYRTFSFKADVTPLALLLDAYCKARAPLEDAARTCAKSFTNLRIYSHVRVFNTVFTNKNGRVLQSTDTRNLVYCSVPYRIQSEFWDL